MAKWIDPLDVALPGQSLLAKYISKHLDQEFIAKSIGSSNFYSVSTDEGVKEFCLKYSVLRRKRKSGKSGFRYEILGDKNLGYGTAGFIYPSLATFVLEDEDLRPITKQKQRVVKVQEVVTVQDLENAQREAKLCQQLIHLHGKEATSDNNKTYIVLKRMPGKNLREIFYREKLSTEQKLQLLLALLEAWQCQILNNGLVHRDIKPENIMVNFTSGNPMPEVNIIDFGFAKKIGDESDELVGTPLYISPEIFEWQSNPEAYDTYPCLPVIDIYALSRLAFELFSENHVFSKQQEHELQNLADKLLNDFFLEKREIKWLVDLSKDLSLEKFSDLTENHKLRLKKLIQNMGCYHPIQRISIQSAIEELSKICQERLLLSKLNYLKQQYPVYQILCSYPQLFSINKINIQSDEKKINCLLRDLSTGKADLPYIEKEVNQITKAWHALKKSNAAPVFNNVFQILSRCLTVNSKEGDTKHNASAVKFKRKIVSYIKTHLKYMITKQDVYGSKRLSAMNKLLDNLERPCLRKVTQATLDEGLAKILSHQFDGSLSHRPGFFNRNDLLRVKPLQPCDYCRDSGIESNNASSNSLSS